MKLYLQADEENDQLYISFVEPSSEGGAITSSVELAENVYGDFDREGRLVGIDLGSVSTLVPDGDLNRIDFDSLMGVSEAAALLGVRKPNLIRDHVKSGNFPSPVVELASGRFWLRSQLESYVARLRRRPREVEHKDSPILSALISIAEGDAIAFRHLMLSHLDRVLAGGDLEKIPTIEEVAVESLREDLKWLDTIRSGDMDHYVAASEKLFRKYYSASRSVIRSLLGSSHADETDELFKELWIQALRQGQTDHRQILEAGSFTRWLLGLAYSVLQTYQFPIDTRARQRLDARFDPIQAVVVLEEFGRAKDRFDQRTAQRQVDTLAIDYLQSLSLEEISEFYRGRRSKSEIQHARKRLRDTAQRGRGHEQSR